MNIIKKKIIDGGKTTETTIMTDEGEVLTLTKKLSSLKEGYTYAPYIPIVNKAIIMDENGTREIWQISRWKRFKLWLYKIIGKLKVL